ncbi:MAG: low molecular weight protein-tyrosine-phosphatase [Leptospiraceae bacterium]|nr:low molecular weight protein-tyrosine-phosphatase [Leptospiraceae bacterium]
MVTRFSVFKTEVKGKMKVSILFVCLGNICRSPAAEGAFTKLVQEKGLTDQFIIDSCGTGDWHIGELAHPNTRKVAQSNGIQLTHRARQISSKDLEKFDYVLAMDDSNINNVLRLAKTEDLKQKVIKFRKFDPLYKNEPDVPDPFHGTEKDFIEVQEIVTRTSESLLEFLITKYKLG